MVHIFLIQISLKFVSKDPIKNKPVFVQIMAWRRTGDKPLSEPMMPYLLMQILSTQPQWVNWIWYHKFYPSETWYWCLYCRSRPRLCTLCGCLAEVHVVIWSPLLGTSLTKEPSGSNMRSTHHEELENDIFSGEVWGCVLCVIFRSYSTKKRPTDGLVQDCDTSSALVIELSQSSKKWSMCQKTQTIQSSDNDSTGFWPPGSLHTLCADGHI